MSSYSEVEAPSDGKATDDVGIRVQPREHRTTVLSERDRHALLEALDNPPAPTRAALDAVRGYRSRIANAG